jgi:P4 family phage/plasmid primase-like protien
MSTVDTRKKKYMCEVNSVDYSISKQTLVKLPPADREEKAVPTNPSEALAEARKIMPMLDAKRATDYKSWFEIGCVLFNVGDGSVDALDVWIDFSKKTNANNFSEATCITRWGKMKKTEYGMGTLIYYAKQDSPEVYQIFRQANSRKSLMESIRKNGQLTSYACAEALYHKYKNDFLYTGNGKDGWYQFSNHRWHQIAEGIELRKLIPTLREPIMEEIKKIREKITDVENERRDKEENNEDPGDDEKKIKEHDKQRSMLMKEKNKLEDTPFKDKILKECKDLFLDQHFLEKTNTNMALLGFKNGVLDLDMMEFREGRPTDYITLTTDYEYREVGDRDEEMRLIDDYLLRVFPNEELRNYFLDHVCSCLRGGNVNKKVVVWSGVGDNSKSIAEDLVKKAFGEYFYVFPTPLLTGKRTQSSAASPELMKSAGTRFAVIQEPSEKEEFNIGMLKELSGNDMIYVRGLYKDSSKMLPQFKLVVICNKLPRVPCDDQATWNRIRVLDYESRFVNEADCPPTFEEQLRKKIFPKVLGFSFTEKMVQAFMSKLFRRYADIVRRGYVQKEPEQITKATKMYRVKNDIFMNFINDKIKDDPESSLTVTDLYGTFKDWYKVSYASYNCPSSKTEIKEYFEKYYKNRFHVNRVLGIRYLTEEDEDIIVNLNRE